MASLPMPKRRLHGGPETLPCSDTCRICETEADIRVRYRPNTQGHLHTPGSKRDSSGTKWKIQRHASALDPSPSLLYHEVGLILIKATLLRGMWVGEHALRVNILLILLTTFILFITPSNTNCISLTIRKYHLFMFLSLLNLFCYSCFPWPSHCSW